MMGNVIAERHKQRGMGQGGEEGGRIEAPVCL